MHNILSNEVFWTGNGKDQKLLKIIGINLIKQKLLKEKYGENMSEG